MEHRAAKKGIEMKEAKDYIIFPLDVPIIEDAKKYIQLLTGRVGLFKVGLELFIKAGPQIIEHIQSAGETGIFLDLKIHDIPATVSRAMERVAEFGVTFATVHCGESKEMLEAAVKGGQGKVGVLGVTVLTSISNEHIRMAGFREEYASDISRLVKKRAANAKAAGCIGVVCSGLEVSMIKSEFGKDFAAVTPGIRPGFEPELKIDKKDDQQRVTTPAMAIKNGSDYLVIGRPIRDAKDPVEAAVRIAGEIEGVI